MAGMVLRHTRVPRSPEAPGNVPAAGRVSSLGLSSGLLHLLNKHFTKLVLLQSTLGQVLLTAKPCNLAVQLRLASRGPPQLLHQHLQGRLQGSRLISYAALWMAAE